MRADGSGSGPLLRVSATHLLLGVAANDAGDALAIVEEGEGSADASSAAGAGSPRRVFVPSPLPCGECPYCRRALVSACLHPRVGLSLAGPRGIELPDRFLTPISEPAWAALPPTAVASAGLVAQLIDATARAGLGPGDTAIWVGDEPWASLGASFSARRSCRTFRLTDRLTVAAPDLEKAPASEGGESVVTLAANADAEGWAAVIGNAEAASGSGHGRPERRIFITSATAAAASAALKLAAPGSTLSFLRGVPATLGGLDRVGTMRVLLGGGYHPDLIPEALAALARGDVDVSGAIRQVTPSGLAGALDDLTSGRDARLPLVALAN